MDIHIKKEFIWYVHPNVHWRLFTIAKTWKQPKCSLTDEWIKKQKRCRHTDTDTHTHTHTHTHPMEYYLAIIKNEITIYKIDK